MSAQCPVLVGPAVESSSSKKGKPQEQELYACKSCLGYHYIEKCIYNIRWKEWLEYHAEYMPSEPAPEYVRNKGVGEINLRENAWKMDDVRSDFRHVTVPNTKLKADLMTTSSKAILLEEQRRRWEDQGGQSAEIERRRQRQIDHAREVEMNGGVDEGSEDELA